MSLGTLSDSVRAHLPEIAAQISAKQLQALLEIRKLRDINHSTLLETLRKNRNDGQPPKLRWGEDGSSKMNTLLRLIDQHVQSLERRELLPRLAERKFKSIADEYHHDRSIDLALVLEMRELFKEINPELEELFPITDSDDSEQYRLLGQYLNYFYLFPNQRFYTVEGSDDVGNAKIASGSFSVLNHQEYQHPVLNELASFYSVDNYRNHATSVGNFAIIDENKLRHQSQKNFSGLRRAASQSTLYQRQIALCDANGNADKMAFETFYQFVKQEELHHAYDNISIAQFYGGHPALNPAKISSLKPLVRTSSDLLVRAETCKQNSILRGVNESNAELGAFNAMIELSGQVKGAMKAMNEYLGNKEYDKAENVFLLFITMYLGLCRYRVAGKNTPYTFAADWFFSEYPHDTEREIRQMEKDIERELDSRNDLHPAEIGLELLKKEHSRNFLSSEEQRSQFGLDNSSMNHSN